MGLPGAGVSIHAPARGATRLHLARRLDAAVSIHAPARGATQGLMLVFGGRPVSIHAPARGATTGNDFARISRHRFQSTRPHGARRSIAWNTSKPSGFNPRARTGRDGSTLRGVGQCCVSIHAPARGATVELRESATLAEVSIHAPARGATAARPPRAVTRGVSIHAPARGATSIPASAVVACAFQSTRPHGARLERLAHSVLRHGFQSTRPHGARHSRAILGAELERVSIHAPARGATALSCARSRTMTCFNPRARTGRDDDTTLTTAANAGFNPRARTGRDAEVGARAQCQGVSIHAPARGATRSCIRSAARRLFQSTRPHGARRGTYRAISPL